MNKLVDSELILNPNGSIYHLNLLPEQVAETIITVGDPDRVDSVSKHFDRLDCKVQKREFVTHTGWIGDKRLTVISTGIGTGNIDIVFNELDALFNIDLKRKAIKENLTNLKFIRIGTSGCLKKEIPINAFLVSEFAVGMDNLLNYYQLKRNASEKNLKRTLRQFLKHRTTRINKVPYVFGANETLVHQLGKGFLKGITLTCPGFYGPQGRQLRAKNKEANLLDHFAAFNQEKYQFTHKKKKHNWQITNFEMETAGIYGMAKLLGHQAISFNALLANRATGTFSKKPKKVVNQLIEKVLETVIK
ncbi:MAG: nucleoside phosphorylase [Saprospiraceae bacterium]